MRLYLAIGFLVVWAYMVRQFRDSLGMNPAAKEVPCECSKRP